MKKCIMLVCVGLLAGGCLPKNTEDYSVLRYRVEPNGFIYQLAVTKKICTPKIAEDLRNSRYQIFTCPVDRITCKALEYGSYQCQCPEQDKIKCNYAESTEVPNEFALRCAIMRWIQTDREFRVIANNGDTEVGATVDRSPVLSASILGVDVSVDAPPPVQKKILGEECEVAEEVDDVKVAFEDENVDEANNVENEEEVDNAEFVDNVEQEAIFDPNAGLLDKVEEGNVNDIEGGNARSGGSDSGWFGCAFYGDDADSRIEFMILLGLAGLVVLQWRKAD